MSGSGKEVTIYAIYLLGSPYPFFWWHSRKTLTTPSRFFWYLDTAQAFNVSGRGSSRTEERSATTHVYIRSKPWAPRSLQKQQSQNSWVIGMWAIQNYGPYTFSSILFLSFHCNSNGRSVIPFPTSTALTYVIRSRTAKGQVLTNCFWSWTCNSRSIFAKHWRTENESRWTLTNAYKSS